MRSLDGLWIFGYGSLLWRPDFPHTHRLRARARDYERRFWQASTDHRGTPERPGRVATLTARSGAECLGAVYRIDPKSLDEVVAYLDHREKNGYLKRTIAVQTSDGMERSALTYIADPDGEHFLGPAPLAVMADQIRASRGPSGANIDYVRRLASALRELGGDAEEVFELELLLRDRTDSGT